MNLSRILMALGCVALISCSDSKSAKVGSPEFYWTAAAETYTAGDYSKTLDDLDALTASSNEYTARAIPWRLTLAAGMVRGHMELAERYTWGARTNRAAAEQFRRWAKEQQVAAAQLTLRLAQSSDLLQQVPLGSVPLTFAFPKGNAAEPPALLRIASGIAPTPAEQEAAETAAVERGVILAVCEAAGSPNDVAKTREVLSGQFASASRAVFGAAIAEMLKKDTALFERLYDPEKVAVLAEKEKKLRAEAARVGNAGVVVTAKADQ